MIRIRKKKGFSSYVMKTIYKFERDMLHGKLIHINKKSDGHWFQKHWHNYYELVYYSGCSGECILNGEKYPIKDNSLFVLTPKDFHQISTNEQDGWYSFIVGFNEQVTDTPLRDAITGGPFVCYDVAPDISEKLIELYKAFCSESKYRDAYIKHLFNCILLRILETASTVPQNNSNINSIVRDSIEIMLSDPTDELSLNFFAKKFKVTAPYFSRLFHESVGITFKQYLTSLRLEYAKQLLSEDKLSIIDIGYECGFNTPSQFFRAFRSAVGSTPSEFRKKLHNL